MKPLITALLPLALLSACAYPTTTVRTADHRPAVAIQGASADAVLYVDGLSMGSAQQFNGAPHVLVLEPGTHTIDVISQGQSVLSEKIFLGDGEIKTLSVGSQ